MQHPCSRLLPRQPQHRQQLLLRGLQEVRLRVLLQELGPYRVQLGVDHRHGIRLRGIPLQRLQPGLQARHWHVLQRQRPKQVERGVLEVPRWQLLPHRHGAAHRLPGGLAVPRRADDETKGVLIWDVHQPWWAQRMLSLRRRQVLSGPCVFPGHLPADHQDVHILLPGAVPAPCRKQRV